MTNPLIEHYTSERVPNPYPEGQLPWQIYHTVRNSIVRCCRRFGPTGPLGECPITNANDPDIKRWQPGDAGPIEYFVVDDQLNDERYIYVELVCGAGFTEVWLRDLVDMLSEYPGCGVGIMAFEQAYMLAFADKVMVM